MSAKELVESKVRFPSKLVGGDLEACKERVEQIITSPDNKNYYDAMATRKGDWYAFKDKKSQRYVLRVTNVKLENSNTTSVKPIYLT